MTEQLDNLTGLTAVGRSDDGVVRAKVSATEGVVGFKLDADHPPMDPQQTLTRALQALRNAQEALDSRAEEVVDSSSDPAELRVAGQAERRGVAENERSIAELERYAAGMRSELEATMDRLGRVFRR